MVAAAAVVVARADVVVVAVTGTGGNDVVVVDGVVEGKQIVGVGRCCSCKDVDLVVVVVVACCTFAGCIVEIPPQQNRVRLTGARVPLIGVDPDFLLLVGRLRHWRRVGQPWQQGERGWSEAHSVDQEPLKTNMYRFVISHFSIRSI